MDPQTQALIQQLMGNQSDMRPSQLAPQPMPQQFNQANMNQLAQQQMQQPQQSDYQNQMMQGMGQQQMPGMYAQGMDSSQIANQMMQPMGQINSNPAPQSPYSQLAPPLNVNW